MATQFSIIRGAGLPPPSKAGRKGVSKYPFADMDVGDAFDAPRGERTKHGQDRTQVQVGRSACAYVKRHAPDRKFSTRILDETTVRVWRIA